MLKHCLIHDDKIFSISEDDFLVKSDKLLVLYVNNIKKNWKCLNCPHRVL